MGSGATAMKEPIVLSFVQAEQLLAARQKGEQSIVISPDLGRSTITTTLTSEGLRFPDGERLSWQDVVKIKKSYVNCFVVEDGSIKTIKVFIEANSPVCSILRTRGITS